MTLDFGVNLIVSSHECRTSCRQVWGWLFLFLYINIFIFRQRSIGQRRAYSELYALLGSRTPDLRRLFLRGHGENSNELGKPQQDRIRRPAISTGELANYDGSNDWPGSISPSRLFVDSGLRRANIF